jgi:hypothetical protein
MNAPKFFRTLLMILILLSAGRALADSGLGGFGDVCEIRPDLCSDDPAAIAKTKALRKKRMQEQKLQEQKLQRERAQQAQQQQQMRAPASVATPAPVYNDSAIDEVEPLPCRQAGDSFNLDADLPVCPKEARRQPASVSKAPAPAAARASAAPTSTPASHASATPAAHTVHVKPARKIVPAPAADELSLDEELEKPESKVVAKEKTENQKDSVKEKTKREPAAIKLKDSISFKDYERDNANNPALAHGMYTEQTAFEYPTTIIQTPIGNVQIKSDPIAGPASFATPTTSSGVSLPPQQIPTAAPQTGGDASSNGQSVREGMDSEPAPGGNANNR